MFSYVISITNYINNIPICNVNTNIAHFHAPVIYFKKMHFGILKKADFLLRSNLHHKKSKEQIFYINFLVEHVTPATSVGPAEAV